MACHPSYTSGERGLSFGGPVSVPLGTSGPRALGRVWKGGGRGGTSTVPTFGVPRLLTVCANNAVC